MVQGRRVNLASCSKQQKLLFAQGNGPDATRAKAALLTDPEKSYKGFIYSIVRDVHPFRKDDETRWAEERKEAYQGAYVAFLAALQSFEPNRRIDLGTFAYRRVRGEVVDSLYEYAGRKRGRDSMGHVQDSQGNVNTSNALTEKRISLEEKLEDESTPEPGENPKNSAASVATSQS